MRVRAALIATAFFATSPLLAQTPSTGAPPKPPAHQPGVPAQSPGAPAETAKATPAAPAVPVEKIDPAKEAAIRHLMDLMQTSKMGDSLSAYVMDGFTQKLASAAPPSAVTDAAVPIYARAFSMEDIQAITQFYESPLGQRVLKALPEVTRESEELGVQMEQKGAMNILQEMSSDYPELKQMLKPQGGDSDEAPVPEHAPAPAAPNK